MAGKKALAQGNRRHVPVRRNQKNSYGLRQGLWRGTGPAGFGGRAGAEGEHQARSPSHAGSGPGVGHSPQKKKLCAGDAAADRGKRDGTQLRRRQAQPEMVHGRNLPQIRKRRKSLPERRHRPLRHVRRRLENQHVKRQPAGTGHYESSVHVKSRGQADGAGRPRLPVHLRHVLGFEKRIRVRDQHVEGQQVSRQPAHRVVLGNLQVRVLLPDEVSHPGIPGQGNREIHGFLYEQALRQKAGRAHPVPVQKLGIGRIKNAEATGASAKKQRKFFVF